MTRKRPNDGKPTPRALRRQALARKKNRCRKLYPGDPQARNANHLAACSCHMCGNPRRTLNERTRKELQAIAVERAWRNVRRLERAQETSEDGTGSSRE